MLKLTRTFIVKNEKGWHARPCSRIVKLLKSYPKVTVFFEKLGCASLRASGDSIFELMKLGVNYGDKIAYTLQGNDKSQMYRLSQALVKLNELLAKEESKDNHDFTILKNIKQQRDF